MSELEALLLPGAGFAERDLAERDARRTRETFETFSSQQTFGLVESVTVRLVPRMAQRSRALRQMTNALLADTRNLIESEESQLKSQGRTFSQLWTPH